MESLAGKDGLFKESNSCSESNNGIDETSSLPLKRRPLSRGGIIIKSICKSVSHTP